MPGYRVIPSVRVRDQKAAVAFYVDKLGFTVRRAGDDNCTVERGDASIMLEDGLHASFYSAEYNDAIKRRLGSASPNALYIEADELAEFYERARAANLDIVDPLAQRPWGQSEFTVADLDGNWLTFWKSLAAPSA